MSKGKSEKRLVVESYDWDEAVSSKDEGVTRVKAFMAIAEDELSVENTDARSSHESLKDEISDLKKPLRNGPLKRKKERYHFLKEVLFTKAYESPSKIAPEITSNSESECENLEPLPLLPKLLGAEPNGTSSDVSPYQSLASFLGVLQLGLIAAFRLLPICGIRTNWYDSDGCTFLEVTLRFVSHCVLVAVCLKVLRFESCDLPRSCVLPLRFGEPDLHVPVPESFHEQTDKELTENDIKRMDADDQAIQTILLGLLEDVYDAVDSCETTKEIWERVRQMMKGSDIEEQEKKAKLFNEWEKFTSTDEESIESYYHRFMQLMNDLKRNKHFPENIAANLKAERLAKTHDPLALMAHSQNSYHFLATHNDRSSSTHSQQSFPINNKYNPQPSLNHNFMQPPMTSLEDINDPTEAMNAALILFAKDRQIHNVGGNGRNQFGQYAGQVAHNQQGYNAWQNGGIQVAQNAVQNAGVQNGGNQNGLVVVPGIASQNETGNIIAARAEGTGNRNQARRYNYRGLGHIVRNCTARPKRRDAAYLQTQLLIAQKEEATIQLQAEEFDFMAAAGDLDEIEEVNANCILMANLQHAFTSEQYTDLLEPIPEPQLVPQNDNHVTFVAPSMVQSKGTVETSSAPNEETRAHQETVYHNLIDQVAQVNMVNCNMRATNAELKSELARYKIQEQQETLELAQESHEKMRFLKKEIKAANYAKINHLSGVFVPQTTKSKEELFLQLSIARSRISVAYFVSDKNMLEGVARWVVGGGGGGRMIAGVGVVCGDGIDSKVGGVVCSWSHGAEGKDNFIKCDMTRNDDVVGVQVKASISSMIVRVPEQDRWCGTRGKFVRWKGVRVTKASKHAKVSVRETRDVQRHDTSVECFAYYKTQGHVKTVFELQRHQGDQDVDAKGNGY
uniref:Gag-Pol polyprotein n=1 Tax=Tanacetum cinerariifolium TaxID=118510 RepID=A0A699H120_TANCI|nr:hypothetical protein [Tanacetum cinerariifolium]